MRLIKSDPRLRKTKLYECEIYVLEDMAPVEASESFYSFVKSNSFVPVSALVEPEVGEAMLLAPKPLSAPMEFITDITNLVDEVHTVYLRLENCNRVKKEGQPLYKITLYDFRDVEERHKYVEENQSKYRQFLSLSNYYFFEYEADTDWFKIYKYIDEKSVKVVEELLDVYFESKIEEMPAGDQRIEQIKFFMHNLRERKTTFEMEFTNAEGSVSCVVNGAVMYKRANKMVGLLMPVHTSETPAYYLSSAAKDAATGLLNKKAAAEYTLSRLKMQDDKTKWIVMMDIDDFKTINDTYGHLFGDIVIQKVAYIMRQVIVGRGILGRFGGDEFYMLLDNVGDRDSLKTVLKTLTKKFLHEFAPQLNLTVSIGISQYPKDATDYETLLGMADKALYIAKEKGKNRHIIYDAALHGEYETRSQRVKALSYTLSKEKRVMALSQLYSNLALKGVNYLKEQGVLSNICEMMDIDAMAVYTNYGEELFCATDGYAVPMPDVLPIVKEENYQRLFEDKDVLILGKINKMATLIPKAYEEMKRRDIASSLQCLEYKDNEPFAWISFDILENSKKWNDMDIERMTILAKLCCKLLCEM